MLLDASHEDVLRMCSLEPGKDYREREGPLLFTPARFDPVTLDHLTPKSWTAGGKASLVRGIQLVEHLEKTCGFTFQKAFDHLLNAT